MIAIRRILYAGLLWACVLVSAEAHQGEVHLAPAKAPVSASPAQSASPMVATSPAAANELDMTEVTPETIASEVPKPVRLQELDWAEGLTGHIHNKLIHFPLALGLAASLLWVLALRQPGHESAARMLLVTAAVMGFASVLTGQAQEGVYEDSALVEIVGWHEKMGFVSLALLILGAGWQWHTSWRKVVWLYGVLLVLVILVTGLLGGIVSHGHLEPAPGGHAPGGHE